MTEGISITYSMPGLDKYERALRTLPEKLAKKHLSAALKKGLNIVQKAQWARVPVKEGRLKQSIKIYQRTRNKMTGATIEFGLKSLGKILNENKRPSNLPALIEYGTKPHIIKPKEEGKQLKIFGYRGGYTFVSHIQHPGAKAKPFINPAIDSNITNVIYTVVDELGNKLAKEIDGFVI